MANLQYSDDAVDILNKFHRVDYMLYVEGQDDVPFWEFLFEKLFPKSVKVEEVGGKPELEKYAKKITAGELNCIVAMDSDFSLFTQETQHPNIIRTFGYSIENSLVTSELLREVIRTIGRIPRREITNGECQAWLDTIELNVKPLVIYDIQNFLTNSGLSILKQSCHRFMPDKEQPNLCERRIITFLNDLDMTVDNSKFDEICRKLKTSARSILDIVRGHFLFSAVLAFIVFTIKKFRGKVSISNESLYGSLMLAFERVFDGTHPHFNHYKSQIDAIVLA